MFKASVNGQTFEILEDVSGTTVNGAPLSWDVAPLADGHFHILLNKKSYRAERVSVDMETKTITLKVNGRLYPVVIKDKFDVLLEQMGMNSSAAGKVNNIKAPMPGLIVDLKVKEGDSVKAGDALIILEAMKMENSIKAPGDAVVKTIRVKKGQSVEKNQVMIEF